MFKVSYRNTERGIYMFKVSYRNTETRFRICSKSKDRENNVPKLKILR